MTGLDCIHTERFVTVCRLNISILKNLLTCFVQPLSQLLPRLVFLTQKKKERNPSLHKSIKSSKPVGVCSNITDIRQCCRHQPLRTSQVNQNDVCANGCVKDVCLRIVASTEILMGESCCGCWLLITPYEGLAIYHDWRVTMTVFLYLR